MTNPNHRKGGFKLKKLDEIQTVYREGAGGNHSRGRGMRPGETPSQFARRVVREGKR